MTGPRLPANTTHDWTSRPDDLRHLSEIRASPELLVGSLDISGVLHLVLEVVAHCVDEAEAGTTTRASIEIGADGSCTISDNGRGTQLWTDPATGYMLVKPVMMSEDLRFFRTGTALLPNGRPRRGMSLVNALSSELSHSSCRLNSTAWVQRYQNGEPIGGPEPVSVHPAGTTVRFVPDVNVFGDVDADELVTRLTSYCDPLDALTITVRGSSWHPEHSPNATAPGSGSSLRTGYRR